MGNYYKHCAASADPKVRELGDELKYRTELKLKPGWKDELFSKVKYAPTD